jgi:ATP-dependent RNA circularization protein (DNA/RNA ligase family)
LYLSPRRVIDDISRGGEIKESFDVKVRREETASELLRHLNRSGIHTQLTID